MSYEKRTLRHSMVLGEKAMSYEKRTLRHSMAPGESDEL